jgi:hypothetical protein
MVTEKRRMLGNVFEKANSEDCRPLPKPFTKANSTLAYNILHEAQIKSVGFLNNAHQKKYRQ